MAKLRPKWSDDRLFNETRRITMAIYQHLVYDEWIPLFLGLFNWLLWQVFISTRGSWNGFHLQAQHIPWARIWYASGATNLATAMTQRWTRAILPNFHKERSDHSTPTYRRLWTTTLTISEYRRRWTFRTSSIDPRCLRITTMRYCKECSRTQWKLKVLGVRLKFGIHFRKINVDSAWICSRRM